MTHIHVASDITERFVDGGLVISESHTWTPCQAGEQGCTLVLPPRSTEGAEHRREVLKHIDLDWLMRRHLM